MIVSPSGQSQLHVLPPASDKNVLNVFLLKCFFVILYKQLSWPIFYLELHMYILHVHLCVNYCTLCRCSDNITVSC